MAPVNTQLSTASASELTDTQQSKGRARRLPGHVPNLSAGFKLYKFQFMRHVSLGEHQPDYVGYSKEAQKAWNNMSTSERSLWEQKAEVERKEVAQMGSSYRRGNVEF